MPSNASIEVSADEFRRLPASFAKVPMLLDL